MAADRCIRRVSPISEMDDQELRETQAAIDEAREQSRLGQALPAEQVFAELRAKYNIEPI
jgi:hypothetical protein